MPHLRETLGWLGYVAGGSSVLLDTCDSNACTLLENGKNRPYHPEVWVPLPSGFGDGDRGSSASGDKDRPPVLWAWGQAPVALEIRTDLLWL